MVGFKSHLHERWKRHAHVSKLVNCTGMEPVACPLTFSFLKDQKRCTEQLVQCVKLFKFLLGISLFGSLPLFDS